MCSKHSTVEKIKVMQAYLDGKQIERMSSENPDWRLSENPTWDWGYFSYRVKKNTIKYRNFLMELCHIPEKYTVFSVSYEENLKDNREKWPHFIKWIGNWQEVEV